MGSLEKGTRAAKTDIELVYKNSVGGTIPKDMALESEKPAVQPGNVKSVWLSQERLCFQGLITAS